MLALAVSFPIYSFHISSPILNFGAVEGQRIIFFISEVPCSKVAKRCADPSQVDQDKALGWVENPMLHTGKPASWWSMAWNKDLIVFTSHTGMPSWKAAGRHIHWWKLHSKTFLAALVCNEKMSGFNWK